jgi:hypothetical protein
MSNTVFSKKKLKTRLSFFLINLWPKKQQNNKNYFNAYMRIDKVYSSLKYLNIINIIERAKFYIIYALNKSLVT